MPATSAAPGKKSDWAEYMNDAGRKYYHNKATNVTQWEKPNELKTQAELAASSCLWKEYQTDAGKKYYYHTETKATVWDEPAEHKAIREAKAAEADRSAREKEASPSPRRSPSPEPAYASRDRLDRDRGERASSRDRDSVRDRASSRDRDRAPLAGDRERDRERASSRDRDRERASSRDRDDDEKRPADSTTENFRALLESAGVSSTWTFDMTMHACQEDPRWKTLRTQGERKLALLDYQAAKRRAEREEKAKKDSRARDSFIAMLREQAPSLKWEYGWRKASAYFEGDRRLDLVPEKDRDDIFEEFYEVWNTEQKETTRTSRRDNIRKLRTKLDDDRHMTMMTRWKKFCDRYKDESSFRDLEPNDRLEVFEEFIRSAEKRDDETRRTTADANRKASRKNRLLFRALLAEKYDAGEFSLKTRYKDVYSQVRNDLRYTNMVSPDQVGSLPAELYVDFLDEMEEKFEKDKKRVKDIIKERKFELTRQTTLDQLSDAVGSSSRYQTVHQFHRKAILEDLIAAMKEKEVKEERRKEKDEERQQKKNIQKFLDLLEDYRKITKKLQPSTPWWEVRESISRQSNFDRITDEVERERLFAEYKSRLFKDSEAEIEKRKKEKKAKKEKKEKKEKSKDDKAKRHSTSAKRDAEDELESKAKRARVESAETSD
eukprot:TRINITY_DN2710_c0_g1_i1.p1 TRINITY_DN2710_c0_g1~~TRINITY_DN2710_c0_g1_i1.p1  ORF type:complete len:663 (-),score=265.05 TRINITY_DN2710_c0_g1_i1:219-2207(-)